VFPSCEIYGGFAGFYDYGPLGTELKMNIKEEWWNTFVRTRDDVVGIDACTINHPMVWKASGHLDSFTDPLVECKKCNARHRADHLIEDSIGISVDGITIEQVNEMIIKHNLKCPKCGGELTSAKTFNLMFKTFVGPVEDDAHVAYLRPETAQLMFTNFKLILDTSRIKLPFGIAQMGRAYRNEISPRDFLFRMREFEQMEIEYFIHPDKINDCPYLTDEILDYELNVYSAEMQQNNQEMVKMTIREALDKNIIKTTWHAYWLVLIHKWFVDLGLNPEKIRIRQHLPEERSHYALDTWDIEYQFPFGWKEIHGMANRTDYDLKQHMKFSNEDLTYFDDEKREKVVPHVIEPSQGVDRAFLAFLIDAYTQEEDRIVLKLHPKLAPYKVGVFPLVNKDGLNEIARKVYEELKKEFTSFYDEKGSIGRRYARQDEIGTPFCITIDYQTKEDNTVTIRDRDTKEQVRVKIEELKEILRKLINKEITLNELK
jgi:glycyl-tRNA synthetase